ncbi:BMP family lipoprotein [Silvanigrella aquatica]|uniref:ABC transporter substrate-binding protein PnrA-like domain-containing protein n=1 Tax=Silvanigrella aquatica TaxID=1915309 RepID=A0A1L4CWW6_9BACT|nr:BMP family ABC transporter substrate-binding protein [Silvanigrella aquatica]APJ02439.1 hypothetical protein AXG55_00190 [Silvanigrella aquatica]
MKFLNVLNKKFFVASSFFLAIPFSLTSFAASNKKPKICLVLDKGGKDDKSFNQSAFEGFTKAINNKKLNISPDSKYVTVREDTQSQQFIRSFSSGDCALVIAVGFNNADTVGKLAKNFPKQKYVLVDSLINEPNVRSISFQEHEGSFIVGYIAAMKTKTKQVSFIGGMEIPLIKRFAMGFEAGVKKYNSEIKITETYVGVTSSAWNNPSKAKEIALSKYNQGNDVIFVAAGGSSQGVFDAVAEVNKNKKSSTKFIIGVDSNQNHIAPGLVLTSMEKKVDDKVYKSIEDFVENKFTTGVIKYGFADSGIDWSHDKHNEKLYTDKELKEIERIKNEIIENKIKVPDYYTVGKKN